jgi:hypothetical protein
MTFGREFTNAVEQKQIAQQEAGKSNAIIEPGTRMDYDGYRQALTLSVASNTTRARQVHCREG